MKKNLSLKLMSGLAVLILMTSCVSKRKYTDAQNTITQLQTENAQLKDQGTTMQTNIVSMEANNRALQSRLDSTNSWVSGQQTRWNSFQAFYDEGTKTAEQVHQQLHQQMDALIGAENITTSGGRVYVVLAEKTLFTNGSSKLTTKGEEVLAQLAQTIRENPNVEIDIASAPGYYAGGPAMNSSTAMADMNTDAKVATDDDTKVKTENTKIKMDKDGDVKMKTDVAKTKTTTAKKSSTYSAPAKTRSTASKSETKSKTYSSSPAKKSSGNTAWSLNMARSSSIAKKLVDEGVSKSRVLVNKAVADNGTKRDFQIVISPKTDTYYEAIGNGGMK